jgi:hypothetical protein
MPPLFGIELVKVGCPSIRSAGQPLVMGIESQMRIRLFQLSLT